MTTCKVCGARARATDELELADGRSLGLFCPGECTAVGWEAIFVHETGGGPYERKLLAWRWSRRRAQAEGRTFVAPAPKSEAEKALDHWAFSLGCV